MIAPVFLAVAVVTLAGQSASCAQQRTSSTTGVLPGLVGVGALRVVQANLKSGLSTPRFTEDLTRVVGTGPDLVSLNEVARRPGDQLTPVGYELWRVPNHGQDGTAVLWRSDRWASAAAGRVIIVAQGPQKWDHDRAATWVTLRGIGSNTAAGTLSMVSVHHMINPAKYGPNRSLRQKLYREGMAKVQDLVMTLSTSGPVFVAGDFNSQWVADDDWGPRAMLGSHPGGLSADVAMSTSMDVFGAADTHDGGGIIDYVFFQPSAATATHQWTADLNSDHNLLGADFTLGASRTAARAGGGDLGLDATQWERASQIIVAGQAMGMSSDGVVIALAVARQESGFRVYANDGRGDDLAPDQRGIARSIHLPHDAIGTDHGSLGVFQQQWPWWGSMEQLMDPATSARLFYAALLKVPGWEGLPLTMAAQAVQHSAFPDAYADDEILARELYAELSGGAATDLSLTSDVNAACAIQQAAAGSGVVVFPVPPGLAATDQHNWGGSGTHWKHWHTGTDFAVPCGTPVLASHAGTVEIDTTQSWAGRWLVRVTVGPGRLTTWYAHMQKLLVSPGQAVTAGQQIGEAGALGNATGCHLHFEVHLRGGPIYGPDNVDPSTWLADHVGRPLGGTSTGTPGSFTAATFNALGDSHTRPGGNAPGWADSATRTRWLVDLLNARLPDVVGLQEFQPPQARVFKEATGGTWGHYGEGDNVIIWRRDSFRFISGGHVEIPYFGGHRKRMPTVRLKQFETGDVLTVINVHNPADSRGPAANWRAEAIGQERARFAEEVRAGYRVLLLGDFNDHEKAFCPLTTDGLMSSASGGSNGAGPLGCQPPSHMEVDWIFGSGTAFGDYFVDDSTKGRISDHPYVQAAVLISS